jgi:hypothetical protein
MAVRPAEGQTIKETKFTTIEPAEERTSGRKHPPMWDFIESLTTEQWNSKEYEFTVYRGTKFARGAYCCKYYELIDPERIKKDFGGGPFNIMMKVPPGKQLRYNEDLEIAGPPKEDTQINTPAANDATGQLIAMFREEMRSLREELKAARGGDVTTKAVEQAVGLSGQVFSSAVTAAQSTLSGIANAGGAHAPNPMSDPLAMIQFLAQVKSLFAPATPTNSLQETLSTIKAFKESGLMGGGGEGKLMDKLMLGLVNQLPTLTQHFSGIMDGYRRAEEAKLNAAALARGVQPPINVQPVQPAVAPPSNVIAMPAPAPEPAPNGQPSQEQLAQAEQMMQYIEQKIVEILANQTLTPEEAAVQALTFIDVTDPVKAHPDGKNLIDQILQHGEMGLTWIFSNRPILQQVPQGERLEAFKKAFLENGRRVAAPENLAPDQTKPPA